MRFKDVKIVACFFHFVQSLWKNANKIGINNGSLKKILKDIILNLKTLYFIQKEQIKFRFEFIQ